MSKIAEQEVAITSLNALRCACCSFYNVNKLVFCFSWFFFVKIRRQKEAKILVVSSEETLEIFTTKVQIDTGLNT